MMAPPDQPPSVRPGVFHLRIKGLMEKGVRLVRAANRAAGCAAKCMHVADGGLGGAAGFVKESDGCVGGAGGGWWGRV